ncbi:MAG: phosphatase PAP2 family protein [Firmicutes bacterium]|nr:phosphatase PAP2 family protein [Bacillota bacterium]
MFERYRGFKLSRLNSPKFRHLKLLLFWPAFGIAFFILERILNLKYHMVSCSLDAKIPFCEFFVIPYYFWFVFLIGMLVWSLLFDIPTFKRYMKYIIITYTATLLIYVIYPTAQDLRPNEFARNNIFTHIVSMLYNFDTNTNVCPSMHVIGSFAVYFSARNSKHFGTRGWRIAFLIVALLISISTVFLKQHSVVDIFAALILCAIVYPFVYSTEKISEYTVNDEKKAEQYI